MTESEAIDQDPSAQPKSTTGRLNQEHLQQALDKALEAGPASLPNQVRYILALSQLTDARPSATGHPEIPITVPSARLSALVELAQNLDSGQSRKLFTEIQQINDDDVRLPLMLELLTRLPENAYSDASHKIWEQSRVLTNPLTRSQVMFTFARFVKHNEIDSGSLPRSSDLGPIALAKSIRNIEGRARSLVALAFHLPPANKITLLDTTLKEVDSTNSDSLRANIVNSVADRLPPQIERRVFQIADSITAPTERARALTALARTVSAELQTDVRQKTLTAIESIEEEDERLSALVALAPHLEPASEDGKFPILLEMALAIAISLTRRNLRARALVALAPHLTLDLQGEALAAVHSLPSERERAMMLAELAPTLPPNMLVASLAVAHTMREQDSRVHALTVLAHYAPEQARSQTLLDALAAASNLPHHYERVTALLALADILPEQLLDQAFTNALETTRHISNENARARALSLLGTHLPPRLLDRALEAAAQINDQQQRFNALIGIIPRVSDDQRATILAQMIGNARQVPIAYKRARAIVALAPHLTQELIADALTIADSLEDPFDRASAYIALAQNLPPAKRPRVIAQAWKLIAKIDDGYDQSSALASIAPFLPQTADDDLAKRANAVVQSIEDEYDRASAITILAPLMAKKPDFLEARLDYLSVVRSGISAALEISQQSLRVRQVAASCTLWVALDAKSRYSLWCEVSRRMTALPLPDVLLCLGALTPVLGALGGEKRLGDIARILGMR